MLRIRPYAPKLESLDRNSPDYIDELDRRIFELHCLENKLLRIQEEGEYRIQNEIGEPAAKIPGTGFEIPIGLVASAHAKRHLIYSRYAKVKSALERRKAELYEAVLDESQLEAVSDVTNPDKIAVFVLNPFGAHRVDFNPETDSIEPVRNLALKMEFFEDSGFLEELRKDASENNFSAYIVRTKSESPYPILAEYAAKRIVNQKARQSPRTHPLPAFQPSSA